MMFARQSRLAAGVASPAKGKKADLRNLKLCAAFLGLRVAHTVLYITTESQKLSYLRSLAWGSSVGCCLILLIKAGNVFVDGKGMLV